MQNIKSILERIWTRVPRSKRSGNILDAMKAYFLDHNFGFSVALLLSLSHMLPPHVHQPLERSREGAVRAARERMGNKCSRRSAPRWCLPGHTSWMWSPTSSTAALVRYGAHPTASPQGHSGVAKMLSMPIGSLGLCPKGFTVCQRFGGCAFNLC